MYEVYSNVQREYPELQGVTLDQYLDYFMLDSSDRGYRGEVKIFPCSYLKEKDKDKAILSGYAKENKLYVESLSIGDIRYMRDTSTAEHEYGFSEGKCAYKMTNASEDDDIQVHYLSDRDMMLFRAPAKAVNFGRKLRIYKSFISGETKVYNGSECVYSDKGLVKVEFSQPVKEILWSKGVSVDTIIVEGALSDNYVKLGYGLDRFKFKGEFIGKGTFLVTSVF